MDFVKNSPVNKNQLSPLGHKFAITRLPNTVYWCQSINVPNLTLGEIKTGNPFTELNYAGDHLKFSPLNVTFKIDEDMKNYLEIYNWMIGLGFPEKFNQFADLVTDDLDGGPYGIRSDASLLVTSSNMNANLEVVYRDIFPIALTDFVFDTRLTTVEYLTATVTFSIRDFTLQAI